MPVSRARVCLGANLRFWESRTSVLQNCISRVASASCDKRHQGKKCSPVTESMLSSLVCTAASSGYVTPDEMVPPARPQRRRAPGGDGQPSVVSGAACAPPVSLPSCCAPPPPPPAVLLPRLLLPRVLGLTPCGSAAPELGPARVIYSERQGYQENAAVARLHSSNEELVSSDMRGPHHKVRGT